jgi:hypothetical protein
MKTSSYEITVNNHEFDFSPQAAVVGAARDRTIPTGAGLLVEKPKYHQNTGRTTTNVPNTDQFEN